MIVHSYVLSLSLHIFVLKQHDNAKKKLPIYNIVDIKVTPLRMRLFAFGVHAMNPLVKVLNLGLQLVGKVIDC